MTTVQFAPSDGSVRMSRAYGIAVASSSGFVRFRVTTTLRLGVAVCIESPASDPACLLYVDTIGAYNTAGQLTTWDGGSNISIRPSSNNVWLDVAWRASGGSAWAFYYKLASSGSWSGPVSHTANANNTIVSMSDWAGNRGDADDAIRYAKIVLWNAAKSVAEIQGEATARTLQTAANAWFYNACSSAAAIGTDASGAGNDFTVTGTPTDNADDPWTAVAASDVPGRGSGARNLRSNAIYRM